jgi:hypothetical protein
VARLTVKFPPLPIEFSAMPMIHALVTLVPESWQSPGVVVDATMKSPAVTAPSAVQVTAPVVASLAFPVVDVLLTTTHASMAVWLVVRVIACPAELMVAKWNWVVPVVLSFAADMPLKYCGNHDWSRYSPLDCMMELLADERLYGTPELLSVPVVVDQYGILFRVVAVAILPNVGTARKVLDPLQKLNPTLSVVYINVPATQDAGGEDVMYVFGTALGEKLCAKTLGGVNGANLMISARAHRAILA